MIMYHGTASTYLPSIEKLGLIPSPQNSFKVLDPESLAPNPPTELAVYLTDSKEIAEKFARLRASYLRAKPGHIVAEHPKDLDAIQMVFYKDPHGPAPAPNAKPVVLSVDVPQDVARGLNDDEYTQSFDGGAFWYPGTIPPSAIVKIDTL